MMYRKTLPWFLFFLAFVALSIGCKEKTGTKAAAKPRAATKRPTKPAERPKPPDCKEGEQTHIRCLAFCGSRRILNFANCVKGTHHCNSGVREDQCD